MVFPYRGTDPGQCEKRMKAFSLACYIFLLIFVFFYLISEFVPFPVHWYFPLEHRWEYTIHPTPGLAMGWYGKMLLCFVLAFGGSVFSYILLQRLNIDIITIHAFLDLAVMGLVIFLLYFLAMSLSHRQIGPSQQGTSPKSCQHKAIVQYDGHV